MITKYNGVPQYEEFARDNVGKVFTTTGQNIWKMIWAAKVLSSNELTYHMKNQETGEELTQLLFIPKNE